MPSIPDRAIRILSFEDSAADFKQLEQYLGALRMDYELTRVTRLSQGLKRLSDYAFDVILLDLGLPDCVGLDTLDAVMAVERDAVVLVFGEADTDGQIERLSLVKGAKDYLVKKTLSPELLVRSIRFSLENWHLERLCAAQTADAQQKDEVLRSVFDASADGLLVLSEDSTIRFLNACAATVLEASTDSLVGEIFPFDLSVGEQSEFEIPAASGDLQVFHLKVEAIQWEGAPAQLVVLTDVTALRKSQARNVRQLKAQQILLDHVPNALIAVDRQGRVLELNTEAGNLLGSQDGELLGKPLKTALKLKNADSHMPIRNSFKYLTQDMLQAGAEEHDFYVSDATGEDVPASVVWVPTEDSGDLNWAGLVLIEDFRKIRRTDDVLFEIERSQTLSRLASGIAHDFNNILTAVLGNLSVARLGLAAEHSEAPRLVAAEKAALQAKSLTHQLLTFSRAGTPIIQPTTIKDLVCDCTEFLLRGSNVKCDVHAEAALWAVDADEGQIGQVVNNLIINADEAMPDGGSICLNLKNAAIDADSVAGLAAGEYVCIEVVDDGVGIDAKVQARIFDAYFTTKDRGNGLGLASSFSIIKNHKGTITVDSEKGVGTTFRVYLPRTEGAIEVEESVSEMEPAVDAVSSDRVGRILVMDDMEAMLLVAGEILKMLGYEVTLTSDGLEAIETYKQAKEAGEPFDVVIFDLTVPGGMGGEEACERLLEYDPELVAIASSGYTTSNVMNDYESSGFKAVVPKPYRINEMRDVLERLLSANV